MSYGIIDELLNLKSKLENLETDLTNQMMEVEIKAEEWHKRDEELDELVKKNKDKVITLDIGGKEFETRLDTLFSFKDTLFTKIISSKKLEINKPIFIDRSYTNFNYILSYLRNKKLNITLFSSSLIDELLEESQFYEIQELIDTFKEQKKEVKFVSFESSAVYSCYEKIIGSNNVEDLNDWEDKSLTKGICTKSSGWIILELNRDVEFDKMDIGGWNGNTRVWGATNGANASILTSMDRRNWTKVGSFPDDYGATIKTVKLTRSRAKYVKFQGNSYLGIGYCKIHKNLNNII